MKKIYFIGLCLIGLASCSGTNDDLQSTEQLSQSAAIGDLSQSAKGGFRGGDEGDGTTESEPPSTGIWLKNSFPDNAIYGFYSNHTKKHLYSPYNRTDMLPRTQPGAYYYYLDRYLGSADGGGQEITGWFNEINEDYVLTTNPSEFNGQNGWRKNNTIGKSYPSDEPGSFPIYRYFRNKTKSHFYTRDFNELGNGKFDFVYEGIAFYLKDNTVATDVRIHDGKTLQDIATGQVYVVFESRLRLFENPEVAKKLIAMVPIKVNIEDYIGPRGENIDANARLVQDGANGKMYFVDHGLLRYIPTNEILNSYRFITNYMVRVNPLRGFVGKDVTYTF